MKKLNTYRIAYSIMTESGEYPNEVIIKARDEEAAEEILTARFQKAGTTDFIIHSIIIT
jgi:hypothetical protein